MAPGDFNQLQDALNDIQGRTPKDRKSVKDLGLRPITAKYNSKQDSGPSSPIGRTP